MFWLLLIITSLYSLFTLLLAMAWHLLKKTGSVSVHHSPEVTVAVIVVVRNEGEHIQALLSDLKAQNYHLMEIVVVDDGSTDDTCDKIRQMQRDNTLRIQLLHLPLTSEQISTKKRAISFALEHTEAELILCTDGDCRIAPLWVRNITNAYRSGKAKFISGPVVFNKTGSFFEKLQAVEFASLIGSGAACIYLGKPTMCNGANMAYPRQVFYEVGGYEDSEHIISGDDELLMHKIYRKYPTEVVFLKNQDGIVDTAPKKNLREFYYQRKRWSSKWRHYQNPTAKLLAVFIFLANLTVLIAFGAALTGHLNLSQTSLLWGMKSLAEITFLIPLLHFFRKLKLLLLIPVVQLIYPFYVLLFGMLSFSRSFEWKGRSYTG